MRLDIFSTIGHGANIVKGAPIVSSYEVNSNKQTETDGQTDIVKGAPIVSSYEVKSNKQTKEKGRTDKYCDFRADKKVQGQKKSIDKFIFFIRKN